MITKFKIFENYNPDDVIREIIRKGYLDKLNILKDMLPEFLEEHFTSLPVKNVKEVMNFYNIKNDNITEVYAFLDDLFSRFEVKTFKKSPDYLFYEIDNERFVNYNQKTKYFYYNYYKIYSILKSNFGLNYHKIKELIQGMVDEHLKLGVVTLCALYL